MVWHVWSAPRAYAEGFASRLGIQTIQRWEPAERIRNFVDRVQEQWGGNVMTTLAETLGASPDNTRTAVGEVVAVAGVVSHAPSPGSALDLADDDDDRRSLYLQHDRPLHYGREAHGTVPDRRCGAGKKQWALYDHYRPWDLFGMDEESHRHGVVSVA